MNVIDRRGIEKPKEIEIVKYVGILGTKCAFGVTSSTRFSAVSEIIHSVGEQSPEVREEDK